MQKGFRVFAFGRTLRFLEEVQAGVIDRVMTLA